MDEIAIDRAIWESPVTWKRKRKNIMEKSEIAAPIFPYYIVCAWIDPRPWVWHTEKSENSHFFKRRQYRSFYVRGFLFLTGFFFCGTLEEDYRGEISPFVFVYLALHSGDTRKLPKTAENCRKLLNKKVFNLDDDVSGVWKRDPFFPIPTL